MLSHQEEVSESSMEKDSNSGSSTETNIFVNQMERISDELELKEQKEDKEEEDKEEEDKEEEEKEETTRKKSYREKVAHEKRVLFMKLKDKIFTF